MPNCCNFLRNDFFDYVKTESEKRNRKFCIVGFSAALSEITAAEKGFSESVS
jgi:hypothetical protein